MRLVRTPRGTVVISFERARQTIKAKYVPRPPRDGETLLQVGRPQSASGDFIEYVRGDYLRLSSGPRVVVAAKPGFSRSGEGGSWMVWEQLLIVRPATQADTDSVAEQVAAEERAGQKVMDDMMSR